MKTDNVSAVSSGSGVHSEAHVTLEFLLAVRLQSGKLSFPRGNISSRKG